MAEPAKKAHMSFGHVHVNGDRVTWTGGQGKVEDLDSLLGEVAQAAAFARVQREVERQSGEYRITPQAPAQELPVQLGGIYETRIGGRWQPVRAERVDESGKVQLMTLRSHWTIFRDPDELRPRGPGLAKARH